MGTAILGRIYQMQRDRPHLHKSTLTRTFILIFLPLAMILAAVIAGMYILEHRAWKRVLEVKETNQITLDHQVISDDLADTIADLMFLAGHLEQHGLYGQPGTDVFDCKDKDMLVAFAQHRKIYDQIRLIDSRGMEKVRVNWGDGLPYLVPDEQLQLKKNRYYFKAAFNLNKGEVYISPFDLNVERGRIEEPIKPMIRYATPIFNMSGQKIGILILNYQGEILINHLKRGHVLSSGNIMLLNKEGYWLIGAISPAKNWAFMYQDDKEWRMEKLFSDAWQRISASDAGQFLNEHGLFTFTTIYPSAEAYLSKQPVGSQSVPGRRKILGEKDRYWKIVSYIPATKLASEINGIRKRYLTLYGVLLVFLAMGSWWLARTQAIRKQIQEQIVLNSRQLASTVKRLETYNRRSRLLNEMIEFLQASNTTDEVYEVIARYAQEIFPDSPGSLNICNSAGMTKAVATWGSPFLGLPVFEQCSCWALRRGKIYLQEDSGQELGCHHFSSPPEYGYMCVPMIGRGKVVGMLNLQFDPDLRSLPEDERQGQLEFLRQLTLTLTKQLSLSLANIDLRDTLHRQSIRDPLTGLLNRRYMEEALTKEVSRAKRHKLPLTVIMVDIDHFKKINDTYGHDAGDAVLQALGRLLANHCRKEDIVCRYGGEEFIIIMPGAFLKDAVQRAEKLRTLVENEFRVLYDEQVLRNITISLGVAAMPEHGSTGEAVVRAADAALYHAKSEGRNRVAVARLSRGTGIKETDTAGHV